MKTRYFLLCFLLAVLQSAYCQQVVFYSDFENWTNGVPDGWFGSLTNMSIDSVEPYTLDPYEGSKSCQLIARADVLKKITSQPFEVEGGKYYKLIFAAKGKTGSGGYFGFENFSVNLGNTGTNVIHHIEDFTDIKVDQWTQFNVIYYAEQDFTAELVFNVKNTVEEHNDILIDDVLLIEINSPASFLDINNLRASVDVYGMPFHNIINKSFPGFEAPIGSGRKTIWSSSLWLAGKDAEDSLYVACNLYRQSGFDFQPGPLADDYLSFDYMYKYHNVWKLNKSEIEYHINNYSSPGYEMPFAIENWPAHGNIENGEAWYLAPFNDLNNNGIYEPENGEYPLIRGDQAIYFIINDDIPHTQTGGEIFGVEIHGMVYAYDQPNDSALFNTVFLSYEIINRSQNTYTDFLIGKFVDFDIGHPQDDYIGCDTVLNLFYAYNSSNFDQNSINIPGYLSNPPVQGAVLLNYELDRFFYFNNQGTGQHPATLDPPGAYNTDYYYQYLSGFWKDGTPHCYGGSGHYSGGGNIDIPTNFMFPGFPENGTGWTEYGEENFPGDRRGVGVTGPFVFYPDESICIDLAFPFARDYDGDHISAIALLRERTSQIISFYQTQESGCITDNLSIEIFSNKLDISAYPNPFNNELIISVCTQDDYSLSIFDINGKIVYIEKFQFTDRISLNLDNLMSGMYFVSINSAENNGIIKVVKQK